LLNTIVFEEGFHPPIRVKKAVIAKFNMWLYKNGVTTNLILKGLFKSGLMENNLTKIEIEGYKKPLLEAKTKGMYYFLSKTCTTFPDTESSIKNFEIPVVAIWEKHDKILEIAPQKKR
jgi:haloalkane dehalogenase